MLDLGSENEVLQVKLLITYIYIANFINVLCKIVLNEIFAAYIQGTVVWASYMSSTPQVFGSR